MRHALTLAMFAASLTAAPAAAQDARSDGVPPALDGAHVDAMAQAIEGISAALLAMPVGPLADALRRVDPGAAMADLPPDATVGDMVHADPQAAQRLGREARVTGDVAAGTARDLAAAMPVLTAMARDLAAQWQARWDDARQRNR